MNEVTNNYSLSNRALEHVFLGEISRAGSPKGYHCNRNLGDENAEVLPDTKAIISGNIFEYMVRSKNTHILKESNRGYSTFFPETGSRQQVLDMIEHSCRLVDPTSGVYICNNILVKIVKRNRNIITFYPVRE